jgi:hypothetical protein
VKPIGYFFLGIPAGALWMALWTRPQLLKAAKELEEAAELYCRAEETFRKIRDVINTPEVPR